MKVSTQEKYVIISAAIVSLFIISSFPAPAVAQQARPIFSMTLIAPGNANLLRRQWAQIVGNALQDAGIDARVVYLGWGAVFDRSILPSRENVGKPYDAGGFDALFIGNTPIVLTNPLAYGYYGGNPRFFAPDGNNFQLYDNPQSNALQEQYVTASTDEERASIMKQWQALVFEDLPEAQIYYGTFVIPANPSISGYFWPYFNLGPRPEWLSGKETVVYATTGDLETLLPFNSQSWYDTIAFAPIFDMLAIWSNADNYKIVPQLAKSWAPSQDGHVFTLNLRENVKWHDGVPFTADDVVWTWLQGMMPEGGSTSVGYYSYIFGTRVSFKWLNGTTTVFNLPGATDVREGRIEAVDPLTVQVTLPNLPGLAKPYGLFDPETLSWNYGAFGVMPKHVFEAFPPAQWAQLPFATGSDSVTYTYQGKTYTLTGPVGTGPYKFVNYDPTATVVHLARNDEYWNAATLKSGGAFQAKDYYIKYIVEKESALAALKSGEADILDGNYEYQKDIGAIQSPWGKVTLEPGSGKQYLAFNMRHPILGTGVDTPAGKADPTKAAEAARNIRKAIDYLIPRDLIIRNLLAGIGEPGTVPLLPGQAYFDHSLQARPFSLEQASKLFGAAGYAVKTNPITATPQIPELLVGSSTHVTGVFKNPTTGQVYSGLTVVIQQSSDQTHWTDVALGATGSDGGYDIVVTPTGAGTWFYRAFFPGVTAAEAAFSGHASSVSPFFDYSNLPTVLAPSYSTEVKQVTVGSIADLVKPFATKDQVSTVSSDVTGLKDQVSTLQGQVSTLTTTLYGAIVLIIVVGVAGFYFARRK